MSSTFRATGGGQRSTARTALLAVAVLWIALAAVLGFAAVAFAAVGVPGFLALGPLTLGSLVVAALIVTRTPTRWVAAASACLGLALAAIAVVSLLGRQADDGSQAGNAAISIASAAAAGLSALAWLLLGRSSGSRPL